MLHGSSGPTELRAETLKDIVGQTTLTYTCTPLRVVGTSACGVVIFDNFACMLFFLTLVFVINFTTNNKSVTWLSSVYLSVWHVLSVSRRSHGTNLYTSLCPRRVVGGTRRLQRSMELNSGLVESNKTDQWYWKIFRRIYLVVYLLYEKFEQWNIILKFNILTLI